MFFCLKVNEKAQVILHSCLLHMKLMLCTIQVHNWGKIHMTFDTTYGRMATRQLQAVLQEVQTAMKIMNLAVHVALVAVDNVSSMVSLNYVKKKEDSSSLLVF